MTASAPRNTFMRTKVAWCHGRVAGDLVGKRRKDAPRMGRPPREDDPQRMTVVLPGTLRRWLEARSRGEGRPQSDVLASALEAYRRRAERKGGKS